MSIYQFNFWMKAITSHFKAIVPPKEGVIGRIDESK
jgi:hypothetical protein